MASCKIVDADKLDADLKVVADAIRAKTGDSSTLVFPTDFAAEIAGIETGGADVTIVDNVQIPLDFSSGNMAIDAGEGCAVKTATILKPDTLIPENIKSGISIAGIAGTHTGSGGASADVCYVTFMNGQEVLYVKPVAVGDDCVNVLTKGLIETPSREVDDYEYTYLGWGLTENAVDSTALKAVTENRTVYAVFSTVSVVAKGSLSDTIHWAINANGRLRVYGQGETPGIFGTCQFAEYNSKIKSVLIDSGITVVGHSFLKGLSNMHTLTVADTVKTISGYTCYQCTALTTVNLPEGLEKIDLFVFCECTSLQKLTIPSSVKYMGTSVARDCSNLSSVTFQKTTGWSVRINYNDTETTALSSSSLANTSTAATYMKTTYMSAYCWINE